MNERSVLAYFRTSNSAQAAKDELLAMGVEVAQIDRISRYPVEDVGTELYDPLTAEISSVVHLTQNSALEDDGRILASSDPAVSGLSSADKPQSLPFLLTTLVRDPDADRAAEIIKKHGGLV